MTFTFTRDPEEFATHTRELLEAKVEHNLLGVVLRGVLKGEYVDPPPLFAYRPDQSGAGASFAALRTPPWGMLATQIDIDLVDEFMELWLAEDPELPRLGGERSAVRSIAAAWRRATGGTVRTEVRLGIYVLERVSDPPRPPAGFLRQARGADYPLLLDWMRAFAGETGAFPQARVVGLVDSRLADGGMWLWESEDRAVSLVGSVSPVGGVARIGPVYTPREFRRRGYAASAVAGVSRELLERGARRCTLYTDLTNPTSNKIYVEVGYRRCGETEEVSLERPVKAHLGPGMSPDSLQPPA